MNAQVAKNNSQQFQANDGSQIHVGDTHYHTQAENEKRDFGIIDEIFKNVIKKLKTEENLSPKDRDHINLEEKITLNFTGADDQEVVRSYLKMALAKVSLIEKRIQEEDNETQNDLQSHIFGKYRGLKKENKKNIEILEELFNQFIIPDKGNSPEYTHLAKAFVLFFFDDCTIFEKTPAEKQTAMNLELC